MYFIFCTSKKKENNMKNKFIKLLLFTFSFYTFGNKITLNPKTLPIISNLSETDIIYKQFSQVIEINDKKTAKKEPLIYEFYSYTVKPNENLFTIHSATNIPYDTLATLNSINDISEKITNKTIIIPTVKGIFICEKPESPIEILTYRENNFSLANYKIICYNINEKVLYFLPDMRFTSTTRAFFLDSTYLMPLEKSKITSDFGMRISPISGNWKFHKGVDLGADEGTPVYACKNGKVFSCIRNDEIFGNYIILSHSNGMTSVYAHLSEIDVKKDEIIQKGTPIGKVGSTGAVTGPHLHFEIRKGGIATNPFDLIKN